MATKAKKKENIFKRMGSAIVNFFKDTKGEMKKVVWPTRKQVLNNLIVVFVFVLICAVIIFLLDLAFGWLLEKVMNLPALIESGEAASSSVAAALRALV